MFVCMSRWLFLGEVINKVFSVKKKEKKPDDEDICEEKSEAFLQYRLEGMDANPGNFDELVYDAEERILDRS